MARKGDIEDLWCMGAHSEHCRVLVGNYLEVVERTKGMLEVMAPSNMAEEQEGKGNLAGERKADHTPAGHTDLTGRKEEELAVEEGQEVQEGRTGYKQEAALPVDSSDRRHPGEQE